MARQKRLFLTEESRREVCDLYNSGLSIDKIALHFGVSIVPIKIILKEEKVPIRSRSEANLMRYKFSKCPLNENFFSHFNSLSCYWAGYLSADGSLDNDSNCLTLDISVKDIMHLEQFLEDIQLDVKPIINADKATCRFSCSYAQIKCDLVNNFNILPNKTKIGIFPTKILDKDNLRHFIRGYYDGNGCLKFERTSSGVVLRVEIASTESFLHDLRTVLEETCGLGRVAIRPTNGTYSLQYGGKQVIRLLDYLQKPQCYRYLFRKTLRAASDRHQIPLEEVV